MLIFVSTIPVLIDKTTQIRSTFSYWSSFTLPFTKKHRRSTWAYIGFGEQLYSAYIWPIFLALNGERTGWSGLPLFAVRCAATVAVSAAFLPAGSLEQHGPHLPVITDTASAPK